MASKFETRPGTAVVGWLGCGVRGWVDIPPVVPVVIGREEYGMLRMRIDVSKLC